MVEDDRARVRQAPAVAVRVGDRDDAVVPSPDDQRGDLHLLEPVEDVVAHEPHHGGQEPGLAGAVVEELPDQLHADQVRAVEDHPEGPVADARAQQAPLLEAQDQGRGGDRHSARHLRGLPPHSRMGHARRRNEHQLLESPGLGDGGLGGHEAAHRVPDDDAVVQGQRVAEVVE